MQSFDAVTAVIPVVAELTRLGVSYYIGGSLAASIYGLARTTLDVDLVADLRSEHAEPLAAALRPAYYVDRRMISDAIARKSCFNVICLANSFKVDVFVQKGRPYDREVFNGTRWDALETEGPSQNFCFPRPEDVVLAKLEWYRLGDEVSDRQWRDVIEVLKTQKDSLDRQYMRKWANELKVADLLDRAFAEAEIH